MQEGLSIAGNLQNLHHNLPGQFNLQNRGLGSLAQAGNQVQQNRYGNQNLPSGMQVRCHEKGLTAYLALVKEQRQVKPKLSLNLQI